MTFWSVFQYLVTYTYIVLLKQKHLRCKKCEVNKKQHCKWVAICTQALTSTEAKKLFIKNPIGEDCQQLVSVDKRDTMNLCNKLHRNISKLWLVTLCNKIKVIFTGLGFNGTTYQNAMVFVVRNL